MRADGRRLGRIIGQLDDLEVLVRHYIDEEPQTDEESTAIAEFLVSAIHGIRSAQRDTTGAVAIINRKRVTFG